MDLNIHLEHTKNHRLCRNVKYGCGSLELQIEIMCQGSKSLKGSSVSGWMEVSDYDEIISEWVS